mmetsp:Transcript_7475/g.13545  ORF Transcript_7475/g.13545 Transcript_7475/m.13545 type:complete len:518 (-) Transcript_7475:4077-5630(-)
MKALRSFLFCFKHIGHSRASLIVASVRVSNLMQQCLIGYVGGRAVSRMQREMMEKVCFGDTTFTENHPPGKLANTFGGSLKQVYLLWEQNLIIRILIPAVEVIVVLGFIGFVNLPFMWLSMATIPLFGSIKVVPRNSMKHSNELTKSFAASQAVFENIVDLRQAIRTSATVLPLLDKVFDTAADNLQRNALLSTSWAGLMGFLYTITSALLVIMSMWIFYSGLWEGKYSAGEVVQVIGYLQSFSEAVSCLGRGIQFVSGGAGNVQDLFELLDNVQMEDRANGNTMKPVTKEIVLRKVRKECPGLSRPILDIDYLRIKAGSMCSILGSSGAGKSTLLHCLARSVPYDSGDICFDEQAVHETSLNSYREQVAVVFQGTMVLNGTIAENIAFGRDITQVAIETAAREAEIHDFIKSLPCGYSTKIGTASQTANLSGGQLQRIAGLARAFAGCPKVLLLDEATSGLDPESERSIFKTLEKMKGKTTIVSVTHRHETALSSDLVVILDNGKILKSGKYDELF